MPSTVLLLTLAAGPALAGPPPPKRAPVTDGVFWKFIDEARAAGPTSEARLRALGRKLDAAPDADVEAFDAAVWGWFRALDRRELWAAADTLLGGCGDDCFMDFRAWLLLQGRSRVLEAVRAPDAMAGWSFAESPRSEGLLSLTRERAKGTRSFSPDTSGWPADRVTTYDWTEADCAKWFPRLTAAPLWKRRAP